MGEQGANEELLAIILVSTFEISYVSLFMSIIKLYVL